MTPLENIRQDSPPLMPRTIYFGGDPDEKSDNTQTSIGIGDFIPHVRPLDKIDLDLDVLSDNNLPPKSKIPSIDNFDSKSFFSDADE